MRAFADVADSGCKLGAQPSYDGAQRGGHGLMGRRDEMCEHLVQVLGFMALVRSKLDDVHSLL